MARHVRFLPASAAVLRRLADIGDLDPPPPRFSWSLVRVERTGRIPVPGPARAALGAAADTATRVAALTCGDVLVLRQLPAPGRALTIDARGRCYVPAWLRDHGELLVGASHLVATVLITPAETLDALGDRLLDQVPLWTATSEPE